MNNVIFRTDQVLHYNTGVWGEMGYAVPNFGNDTRTLNAGIFKLTEAIGRNLSAIMHHQDALMNSPPSINTLTRVHMLILRARTILASRTIPSGQLKLDTAHSTPSPQTHLIFPVPYFKITNTWMKEWCGLVLTALSVAMQHTENVESFEISENFSGMIGQYLQTIYRYMATELFQVPRDEASDPSYVMSNEVLASYNPGAFIVSTELIDVLPEFNSIPTEDDLKILTRGIPASLLINLSTYPDGNPLPTGPFDNLSDSSIAATATTSRREVDTPPFPNPPLA